MTEFAVAPAAPVAGEFSAETGNDARPMSCQIWLATALSLPGVVILAWLCAFYLMDDAFRLGEYINVGEAKGTVERIGIRSMHLRHHRGPLNIVPYGGIKKMTNESRDWVVEKLEFRLTYDTDIAKVKKIVKRIGQELQADPEMGRHIIQPLKSQGVLAMEDSALLVKAKFTAKPGEQFVIRREAYQRLKQAFDEAGIHFAHRQVTVFVPPGSGGAAAGAAAAAVLSEKSPQSAE
jgi:small-conductance mechanosensitive channel